MKIIYLHQYFKTPTEGGAIRSYYLAKALVDAGHEVEMITSHNQNNYSLNYIDGIKVHYLPVFYQNKYGFWARIWAFIMFLFKAYQKAKSIRNVDLCYASSTPLTVGLLALRLKIKHNIPYFFEVRDLWPEAPIQLGYVKNRFLKKILFGFENEIYKNAEKIVALSPGICSEIESKISHKKVVLLPNMCDCDFFTPQPKANNFAKIYGFEGKFVVAYIGALGKVNYLQSLIEVMLLAKQQLPEIHFVVAGEGGELAFLLNKIDSLKLHNCTYLGSGNKEFVREILNQSDASFVSFQEAKVLETNSPNKFFDSLAAGKLVCVNTKGWLKDLVESHECGFYFSSTHAEEYISKITPFVNNKNLLSKYQNNARQLAISSFNKQEIGDKFVELFQK
jgi:glycosyltransferase involved in cell wall biosynthesis